MIIYDCRKLGGYEVFFRWTGSSLFNTHSFPHACIAGSMSAVYSYVPEAQTWLAEHILNANAYFGGIAFIVGFVVVYRAQISYQRYIVAQESYFGMCSKMHDFASFMNAFLIGDTPKTKQLRKTLIRWIRAYHELAVEEFQGVEFSVHVRSNLTLQEVELLARDRKRQIQLSSWMHRLIMENRDDFKAGDAILSRAFQISTDANLFFNQCRRVAETPFPFPFVQLTSMIIHMWLLMTPVVVGTFFPTSYVYSFLVSFVSVWILFAVNELAAQLEQPFEETENNLPVVYYSIAFDDDMSSLDYMEYPDVFDRLQPDLHKFTHPHRVPFSGPTIQSVPKNVSVKVKEEPQETNALSTEKVHHAKTQPTNQTSSQDSEKGDEDRPHIIRRRRSSAPSEWETKGAIPKSELLKKFRVKSYAKGRTPLEFTEPFLEPSSPPSPNHLPPIKEADSSNNLIGTDKRMSVFDLFGIDRKEGNEESVNLPENEPGHQGAPPSSTTTSTTNPEHTEGSDNKPRSLSTPSAHMRPLVTRDDSTLYMLERGVAEEALKFDKSTSEGKLNTPPPVDKLDDMDNVMYHTVHGADGVRMARALQLEREAQRRIAANRALALRLKIEKQRKNMRHHIFATHSVNAAYDLNKILRVQSLDSSHVDGGLDMRSDLELLHIQNSQEGSSSSSSTSGRQTSNDGETNDVLVSQRTMMDSDDENLETVKSTTSSARGRASRLRSLFRKSDHVSSSSSIDRDHQHEHHTHHTVDIVNYPGFNTESLTQARSKGLFQVID